MSKCRQYLIGWCTVLLLQFAAIECSWAQNLTNEKIQVAADALTVLKFNSEITHCELGMRDGFTCLVRDNDNTVVIKTLQPIPASTNLAITEGRRTHYFVLVFLPKIDINNTRLFYDYSDIKTLKKLVKKREEGGEEAVALATSVDDKSTQKTKKELEAERKMQEAEQKKIDEQLAREQEQERQKKAAEAEKQRLAEEKARKVQEEKEAAALAKAKAAEEKKLAAAEKARKAEEKAAAAKAKEAEKLASTKTAKTEVPAPDPVKPPADAAAGGKTIPASSEPPKLSRREERILRKEKEAEEALAKAEAEEKRKQEEAALAAKEKARQDELRRQEALAAEEQRMKEEELQKQKEIAAAKASKKAEAERKKQELAAANEAKRQETLKKQKEEDAARASLQSMLALRKRYPTINFADIPEGQMITGEYFIPVDTQENYQQSMKAFAEEPCLGIRSDMLDGIDMRLEDVNFSGVNAYLRVLVRNTSKKEFLVGRMLLRWNKEDGGGYNLFACYVTSFPVIPPGGEARLVYVARGVNAKDNDMLYFRMSDRVREGFTVEVPFSGKVYNDEMIRK